MGLSKEQVERHIAGVEKRLGSAQERAHHGYEFARLCVEVQKHSEAIKYLSEYLCVQEKDFRAHRLMGQVCEREGDLEKAVVHYNRSLQLKGDQREVAISVAKLYCKMDNPPLESLKACLERVKPFSNIHSLVLALNEKLLSIEGSVDHNMVTKLAVQQLELYMSDVATHIRLMNQLSSTGELEKAMDYCLAQRKNQLFSESREWLMCALQIAEERYVSVKGSSPLDHVSQCHILITILDHLSLLFHTSGASGQLMASILLKYDKVLFVALQSLRSQQPLVLPLQRMALRELCGQYYLLVACYMYWGHWFRSSVGGRQALKHSQIGNLCLLASLSFPPPNLDPVPLPTGLAQKQEVEAWHTRACKRLCVVARQLLLVSKQKGDIYLGGLPQIVETQGGKLAIIRALFTENEDLRGVKVQFASTVVMYNIRSSYMAAESEHLLAQGTAVQLPSEAEAQLCDQVYVLSSGGDLASLLWLCLCLRAMESSSPIYSWLADMCPSLPVECQMTSHLHHTDLATLSLCDVEAVLVLSTDVVQSSLPSPPSHSSLPESLLHYLPTTMATTLDGADVVKFRQWWSCVHQWLSGSVSTVDAAAVKHTVSEGLGLVRGCRPLRLSVKQLSCLAHHFQQRAEALAKPRDSGGHERSSLLEALLKRSSHYWEILVDILTDRDSYRDTPKYSKPQPRLPRREGGTDKVSLTSQKSSVPPTEGDQEKVSLLSQARMALGDAAAYRGDITRAVSLYSRVKTAQAAWNQAQLYVVLAQQRSTQEASKKDNHLQKAAETLEVTLTRLSPSDKEFRGKVEEKQEEVKQLLSEEQRRQDIAISLHYDSSPESSPPVPRKASTPSVTGAKEKLLSPLLLEKKSPSQTLSESLREELREKNSLILSMSEQLKNLQAEVSQLKLHLSPVPRHPHPSLHTLHQASPQAVGGAPSQFLSPGGVAMYQPHPSLGSSFRSPLVHQQSPVHVGVPSQPLTHSPITYYASPQHHLTPLPPHLSPSTLSISNPAVSQMIRGHPPQPVAMIPQQTATPGLTFRPGHLPSSHISSGTVAPSLLSEQPLLGTGAGVAFPASLQQYKYQQQQMQLKQSQQMQYQLLDQQHQFLQQQPIMPSLPTTHPGAPSLNTTHPGAPSLPTTHPGAPILPTTLPGAPILPTTHPGAPSLPTTHPGAPSLPTTHPGAPSLPTTHPGAPILPTTHPGAPILPTTHPGAPILPTTHPGAPSLPSTHPGAAGLPICRPSHPDPVTTGFVLKPGTFIPASSLQQQQKDVSSAPSLTSLGITPVPQPSSGLNLQGPGVPSASINLPTPNPVSEKSEKSAPSTTSPGAAVIQPPFASTLPLSGGFQFSMKPSLIPSPAKPDERSPPTNSTQSTGAGTLASLLQSSTSAATSSLFATTFSLGTSVTTSPVWSTSLPAMTTPSSVLHVTATTATSAASGVSFTSALNVGQLGTSLFVTTSPSADEKSGRKETEQAAADEAGDDQDVSYDARPDFKPIVSLPELGDIRTGEEDEKVLFSHRAKLYRFDSNKSVWKERGIGDMKILEHKVTGKARVLMRREQILKLCCNHYITAEMTLTPLQGNNQLAWYTHCDFADGLAKPEKLAVKFKLVTVTDEYRKVFEACVTKAKAKGEDGKDEGPSSPLTLQTTDSLREKFSAPAGSWECDTCLIQNQPSSTKCVACGADKPGSSAGQSSSQKPSSLRSDSLMARFAAPVGSWECSSCLVQNKPDADQCVACGSSRKSGPSLAGMPATSGAASLSVSSTMPFKFGGATSIGEHGGLKLGSLSFGTPPVSFAASAVTSGGFKADIGSGGFKLNTSLFGTTPMSMHSKSDTATSEPPTNSSKPGNISFGTLSSTTESGSGIFSTQHPASTEGGWTAGNISFPPLPQSTATAAVSGSGSTAEHSEGVLKLEPFTSATTASDNHTALNFASLFSKPVSLSTEAGGVSSSMPCSFGTSLDSFKLPTVSAPEQEGVESHELSAHEPDIHFDPIVTLPEEVDVRSGEENEDVVFAERAKLFRFDSNLKQWKERGVGEMKVLVNRHSRKARLLMRRDQVLKICCNHFITQEMALTPMSGSNKAWTWFTLCDFADETRKPEKLAVRFKSPIIADAFKKAFEEAVDCANREMSAGEGENGTEEQDSESESHSTDQQEESGERSDSQDEGDEEGKGEDINDMKHSSTPLDLSAKFGPKVGSWECDSCYVANERDNKVCCACGQSRPTSDSQTVVPSVSDSHTPPSLVSATHASTPLIQQQIKFGTRLKITPRTPAVKESSPEGESYETHSSSSSSRSPSPSSFPVETSTAELQEEDASDVVIVAVELPSEEKVRLAEKYMLPPSFYNYETQPPCPGCRGCVDLLKGPFEPASSEDTADGADNGSGSGRREETHEGEEGESTKKDEQSGHFTASHSSFSFSSLAASATGGGGGGGMFWGQKDSKFSGFRGAGSQLFAAKPATEEESDKPEAEVDINFRPVVTLEAVETRTGEEGEECLFSHRAKLYRFDSTLSQWKERGLGDIKILRNTATQRSRVVMRREQILKICCNHLITPEMKLQANISSQKSWTWKTLSDFAEETAQEEMFSIRFKHLEVAQQFAEVFRSCQVVSGHTSGSELEPQCSPTTPPGSDSHGTGAQSSVADKASSSSPSTCKSLKEILTSTIASETDTDKKTRETDSREGDEEEDTSNREERGVTQTTEDSEPGSCPTTPPEQEDTGSVPSAPPVTMAVPQSQSTDTTPRLRLPLTPPPNSSLSVGTALRLPLTQPQQESESESVLPESVQGEGSARAEEGDRDESQASQSGLTQAPLFGSAPTAPPSFADLASSGSTSSFLAFRQKQEGFQFSGFGQKLFSSEASEDPENEADVHFQPIVSLPEAVKVKSWDEDADTAFCQRSKLYRFDLDTSAWKERGLGELKIMRHRHTGQVKLIMRRDQILKICCNHNLTPDMEVKPMATSEKACVWFTSADYTDQVVRPEKLCAKFKTVEIASEFREAFDRCKAELMSSVEGGHSKDGEGEGEGDGEGEEREGEEREESKGERGSEDSVGTVSTLQVTDTHIC